MRSLSVFESAIQRRGGYGLEIVGAIEPGGAVPVGGAHFAQRLDQVRDVLGAVEQHYVFEQVRESGLAMRLILRADIVPRGDGDDRRFAVFVHENGEAVVEREAFVRDLDALKQLVDGRQPILAGCRRARRGAAAQRRRKHQHSRKRSLHRPAPLDRAVQAAQARVHVQRFRACLRRMA
jgi:hypothetical protein